MLIRLCQSQQHKVVNGGRLSRVPACQCQVSHVASQALISWRHRGAGAGSPPDVTKEQGRLYISSVMLCDFCLQTKALAAACPGQKNTAGEALSAPLEHPTHVRIDHKQAQRSAGWHLSTRSVSCKHCIIDPNAVCMAVCDLHLRGLYGPPLQSQIGPPPG